MVKVAFIIASQNESQMSSAMLQRLLSTRRAYMPSFDDLILSVWKHSFAGAVCRFRSIVSCSESVGANGEGCAHFNHVYTCMLRW